MRVLNQAFGHPLEFEERAADPLAGGMMRGYQCGMLWGATLAAGAQAYRILGKGPQAEAQAIIATQRIVESFRAQNKNINCREITGIDLSAPNKQAIVRFLIKSSATGSRFGIAARYAKAFGAEVTAVCSTRNAEQARSLGADHILDYTKEDFTQSEQQYNLILAVTGYHPLAAYKRALAPGGIYVMAGGTPAQMFQALLIGLWMSMTGGKKMGGVSAKSSQKDVVIIKELLEAGRVVPVIDKRYPLSEVPEALRYLGAGHARGKVVITVAHDSNA